MDKISFGRRVVERREKLEIVQTALADQIGMKQQGVASIEAGDVARPRKLRELARTLRTTEEWLLWGEGPEDIEILPKTIAELPANIRIVPELSWVSAGRFSDVSSALPTSDVPLLAFSDLGRGDFFALRVQGDSMDRISPEGSKIIVNRAERNLVSGKHYVFEFQGETTFKSWQDGDPPYLLPQSTNPMHRPIIIKRKRDYSVVGRVRRTILDM